MSEAAALIIIDMQRGMTDLNTSGRNNPGAEGKMEALLAAWRQARRPVVHVRHLSRFPASPFWPGQAKAECDPRFAPRDGEHLMEKNVTDAFANSGLERWLHVRDMRALVIVGVSTNFSVEATARSAGCLGFSTSVVADATYTFDMQGLDGKLRMADDVHLASLSNLHGEYACIVDTAALLARAA